MRNLFLFLCASILLPSNTWNSINSTVPKPINIDLVSSDIDNTIIRFEMDGFHLIENFENSYIARTENGASMLNEGNPDLHKISASVVIPDRSKMKINVLSSKHIDYKNINISPSKGNLSREINPNDVPFTYSDTYSKDEFYPSQISTFDENPYILRDLRGQAISFNPFQYNPITKVLRVYSEILIELIPNGLSDKNIINRNSMNISLPSEYNEIYASHFINYNNDQRFSYLIDQGDMLIISNSAFMETMQPLVDWKNKKGIRTEIISSTEIGSSSSQIASYIEDYYATHDLAFVLLVGDYAQITSPSINGSASDPSYGFISGNDAYAEVMIGRFSGSTPMQIETQVQRTIEYENNSNGTHFNNALGIASNQGPGMNGFTDDQYNDWLWSTVLSLYNYDEYFSEYDGSGGTDQGAINTINNNGVGIINYTGHGSISSWGNGASLNTTQINSLTNNGKLPLVITVGCNVGEFNSTNECYTESWMRATNNGSPSGSIAHYGSTISQSWEPPMHGQWAMNKIITESYSDLEGQPNFGHKTRTIGGIVTNGCLHMNDAQGSSGTNETNYWTLFGDPSVVFRTDNPSNMSLVHDDVILVGQPNFIIETGLGGSLAALSQNGNLLTSGYADAFGTISLEVAELVAMPGVFDLVITGYNAITYETEITVLAPEGPYVMMDAFTTEVMYGNSSSIAFDIENVGSDDAENLIITLSTDDQYVSVTENLVTMTLAAGETTTVDAFSAYISANIPNGHGIVFDVSIVSESYSWDYSFNTTAMAPEINLLSISGDLQPGSTSTVIIEMANNGGAPINYPVVGLDLGQYLTASNIEFGNAYYWDMQENTNIEQLTADITVSSSAPMGSTAELTIMIESLNTDYYEELVFNIPVGQVTAGFETGLNLVWETPTFSAPWEITDEDAYSGAYAFKSSPIENNQTSSTSVTLEVTEEGNIEFWYRVSAEYSGSGNYFYDGLEFYIDDVLIEQFQTELDGSSPWKLASFPVIAGEKTFRWTFAKDGAGGSTDCINTDCLDAAFVDNIVFPPVYIESDAILGDTNGDEILNVLDVIAIVNMALGNTEADLNTADMNGDGLISVLDIIALLNIILDGEGRVSDASSATMNTNIDGVSISANGYIGAIELTLTHDLGFSLLLTDKALVADYNTDGTSTKLIVVAPEDIQIFTTSDTFIVDEVLVTNSESFIEVTEMIVEFGLSAAYPNPFNPTTTLEFSAIEADYASVKVYNLMGQVVGVLLDGIVEPNIYSLTWDANNLSSGVYMIKAESSNQVSTQKIMLLK